MNVSWAAQGLPRQWSYQLYIIFHLKLLYFTIEHLTQSQGTFSSAGSSGPPGSTSCVPCTPGAITSIATAYSVSCVAGTGFPGVTCWGNDGYQQISNEPAAGTYTSVSAGYDAITTCAITSTAALTCWGYNGYNLVSNAPATGTFSAVSVGYYAACAITSTATITCWGNDASQQISNEPSFCF